MLGQILALWWSHVLGRGAQQSSPPAESFLTLFLHVLRQMAQHMKFEFHHNQVSLIYFTTKNRSSSFFYTRPHQWYESFKFGALHFLSRSIGLCWFFLQLGNGDLKSQKGKSHWWDHHGSLPLESFPDVFLNVSRCQFKSWFIHSVGCTTYWVHVSPECGSCDLLHLLA